MIGPANEHAFRSAGNDKSTCLIGCAEQMKQ